MIDRLERSVLQMHDRVNCKRHSIFPARRKTIKSGKMSSSTMQGIMFIGLNETFVFTFLFLGHLKPAKESRVCKICFGKTAGFTRSYLTR